MQVLVDTGPLVAVVSPTDQYHQRAVELAKYLESNGIRLITTRAVSLEIGNALAKQRYRGAAIILLSALDADPNIEVIPLSDLLYKQAFEMYQQRHDKEWGMTDCVSFVLMQDRGLTDALTADDHFRQAGFRALLRDS